MKLALLLVAGVAALSSSAATQSGSLFTLTANNGGGALGGAIYFDLTVVNDLTITSLDLNCLGGRRTSVDVYVVPGTTHVGNELLGAAFWGAPIARGNITAIQPIGTLSSCPISLPLLAGSYAVAIVNSAGHAYTNGNGSNQVYSNADLTLEAGAASNVPFAGSLFVPRVWNGRINYDLGASGVIASSTKSGQGCGGSPIGDGSFYESFASGQDLMSGFSLAWNGSGYDYTNGAGAIVPPSGTGAVAFEDDDTREVPLGFALPSPAGNDTSVWMCSNGFMAFEPTTDTDFSDSIADLLANDARLAVHWCDLNPTGGGSVHTEAVSGSEFHITFSNVPEFGSSNVNSFQIALFANGDIECRFGQTDAQSVLVGLSTGDGASDPGGTDLSASGGFTVNTGQFVPDFDIQPVERPVLGTTATLEIVGEAPGAVTAVQYGVPTGGIPLDVAGFPGCFLYVDPIAIQGPSVAIPNDSNLLGVVVSCQAASIAAGLYPNNAVASGQVDWLLGNL